MNALANSQIGELDKFINLGYPDGKGPVTFARYTGQESDEERHAIIANPPDILLTNYVMMELILTRPFEQQLRRGRARACGSSCSTSSTPTAAGRAPTWRCSLRRDPRRLRRRATSSTSARPPRWRARRDLRRAAAPRSRASPRGCSAPTVEPEHVIGETLRRATSADRRRRSDFMARLCETARRRRRRRRPTTRRSSPIRCPPGSRTTFGLTTDAATGRLIRAKPRADRRSDGAAPRAGGPTGHRRRKLREGDPRTTPRRLQDRRPGDGVPSVRLPAAPVHQPRRDRVRHARGAAERYLTTQAQQLRPRRSVEDPVPARLLPGVRPGLLPRLAERHRRRAHGLERATLERPVGRRGPRPVPLRRREENPWPDDAEEIIERLPDDWLEDARRRRASQEGHREEPPPVRSEFVRRARRTRTGSTCWFVPAPFRFCLRCGVAYTARQRSDFAKLATLGSGGRSTATTILSLVRRARPARRRVAWKRRRASCSASPTTARTLLCRPATSTTSSVGLLRSALFTAAERRRRRRSDPRDARPAGVRCPRLPARVLRHRSGGRSIAAQDETDRALRDVIGYRLYRDLMRGWRITSPNLEQCGLLEIDYRSLEDSCATDDDWQGTPPGARARRRRRRASKLAEALLDHMRRELAIKVDYLERADPGADPAAELVQLRSPWAIDEDERLEAAAVLFPRSAETGRLPRLHATCRPLSGFGQYLRRPATFAASSTSAQARRDRPSHRRSARNASDRRARRARRRSSRRRRMSPATRSRPRPWCGRLATAPQRSTIRSGFRRAPEEGRRTNHFFVRFYRTIADDAPGSRARASTRLRCPPTMREEREDRVPRGEAPGPVLLADDGARRRHRRAERRQHAQRPADARELRAAERPRGAKRSAGARVHLLLDRQPARPVLLPASAGMVSGRWRRRRSTSPTRTLSAPTFRRSGWPRPARASAARSATSSTSRGGPVARAAADLKTQAESPTAKQHARERPRPCSPSIGAELTDAPWFDDGWLDEDDRRRRTRLRRCAATAGAPCTAPRAKQREQQNKVIGGRTRSARRRRTRRSGSARGRGPARAADRRGDRKRDPVRLLQLPLLRERGIPARLQLPAAAAVGLHPGRPSARQDGEFVSRPRFLAISEFGPRSFIYHEGSRYIINRVLCLPDERSDEGEGLATRSVKWCATCGYLHPMSNASRPGFCERCDAPLDTPITNLFRLQNVATKRRDRISSTRRSGCARASRSAPASASPSVTEPLTSARRSSHVGETPIATADLRRQRRDLAHQHGLAPADEDRRAGLRARHAERATGPGTRPTSSTTEDPDESEPGKRVIPYVEDRRNALLFEFTEPPHEGRRMASLQAALKSAIQRRVRARGQRARGRAAPDA